jgi:hypothetical protein
MRHVVALVLVATLVLLAAAAAASSQQQPHRGELWVAVRGWGSVKLGRGVLGHRTVRCTNARCPAVSYLTRGPRAVIVEKPYQGWKFVGWRGACEHKRPRCVAHVARGRPNAFGVRQVHVGATFVPVAPGLTRGHPIPLGTTADVTTNGWRVRVNSATANVQLSPDAPSGAEYFDANVTIGYFGGGSATPEQDLAWKVTGSHETVYNIGSDPCPYPGPQPALGMYDPVYSGQSVTGYVCWQIATNDAGSLELYFGSGSFDYPGTTWFALH